MGFGHVQKDCGLRLFSKILRVVGDPVSLSLPLGLVTGVEQRLVHGAGFGVILDGLAALGWSTVSFLPIGHLAAASLAPTG